MKFLQGYIISHNNIPIFKKVANSIQLQSTSEATSKVVGFDRLYYMDVSITGFCRATLVMGTMLLVLSPKLGRQAALDNIIRMSIRPIKGQRFG